LPWSFVLRHWSFVATGCSGLSTLMRSTLRHGIPSRLSSRLRDFAFQREHSVRSLTVAARRITVAARRITVAARCVHLRRTTEPRRHRGIREGINDGSSSMSPSPSVPSPCLRASVVVRALVGQAPPYAIVPSVIPSGARDLRFLAGARNDSSFHFIRVVRDPSVADSVSLGLCGSMSAPSRSRLVASRSRLVTRVADAAPDRRAPAATGWSAREPARSAARSPGRWRTR